MKMKIKYKLLKSLLTLSFAFTAALPGTAGDVRAESSNNQQVLNEAATPVYFYNLGRKAYLRLTKKGFQEAIDYYNQAISLDKKFAKAYAGRSEARVLLSVYQNRKNEKYSQAQSELDAYESAVIATKLDPNLADAHRALSMVYSLQERYDEGKDEAKKAIELDKTNADAYLMLWINNDKPDPEDQNIITSLSLEPNNPLALMHSAFACLEKKDVNQAAQKLKRVTEITPENELAHMYLGIIYYYHLFKTNEAIDHFNIALTIDPENPYVNYSLGIIYFNRWNTSKAVEYNKKACSLDYKLACDWLKDHGNK